MSDTTRRLETRVPSFFVNCDISDGPLPKVFVHGEWHVLDGRVLNAETLALLPMYAVDSDVWHVHYGKGNIIANVAYLRTPAFFDGCVAPVVASGAWSAMLELWLMYVRMAKGAA